MMSMTFEQRCKRLATLSCIASLILLMPLQTAIAQDKQADQILGWVDKPNAFCGGYYHEPFATALPPSDQHDNAIHITGDDTLFSQRDTTILKGHVSFRRYDETIRADKATLSREQEASHAFRQIELTNNIDIQQPNTIVKANRGTYDFKTKVKFFYDVAYRLLMLGHRPVGKQSVVTSSTEVNKPGEPLTAWGTANQIKQVDIGAIDLTEASYSTCPPIHPLWLMKARDITLDRESGRGSATHVTLRVKEVPIFYLPYINFPIDARRKTGLLWPSFGTQNGAPYVSAPFYWNIAPNYDMLLTPTLFSNRGIMLADTARYLHSNGHGDLNLSILPDDRYFDTFKTDNMTPNPADTSAIQASKTRLANSSTTRYAFVWHDDMRYNDHWSSHVNISQTSDDYFLRDFGNTLQDVSLNQLLQEAEMAYQSQHWRFLGRLQAYQTLHPFNEAVTLNQYRRFPQLTLSGQYPEQQYGLEYFMGSELTNFDIRKTPGADIGLPIGQRGHVQPGVSLPLTGSFGFITPRLQLALSQYNLHQTSDTATPNTLNRALPILDIATGATLERHISIASHAFKQTLEPQIYYTYIPYRRQFDIPLFDTTVNTPTYDQLFNYNRFSGLDRIGDANQVSLGVSTRLIDHFSGLEKLKLGVGDIMYFSDRNVTLCQTSAVCNDYPEAHANQQRFSPISGTLDYHIVSSWNMNSNMTWDPVSKQIESTSIGFHYQPETEKIFNVGLNYVNRGALAAFKTVPSDGTSNAGLQLPPASLKVTDASIAWPITSRIAGIGRVSHDWASGYLQNVLYGIQYDTCCVIVRLVGNHVFLGLNPDNNNKPQYKNEFYIQISLKGLGNVGNGNPQSLLNNITGYTNSQFG